MSALSICGPPGILDKQLKVKVVKDKLLSKPCRNQGFVLDSFPETCEQARELFSGEAFALTSLSCSSTESINTILTVQIMRPVLAWIIFRMGWFGGANRRGLPLSTNNLLGLRIKNPWLKEPFWASVLQSVMLVSLDRPVSHLSYSKQTGFSDQRTCVSIYVSSSTCERSVAFVFSSWWKHIWRSKFPDFIMQQKDHSRCLQWFSSLKMIKPM